MGSTAKQTSFQPHPQKTKEICGDYNRFSQDKSLGVLQNSGLGTSRKSWPMIQEETQENSVNSTALKKCAKSPAGVAKWLNVYL